MTFSIQPVDTALKAAVTDKIDNLTKPKGSLGRLEELAARICLIQQTLTPELRHPHNVLFAADHGVIAEGVSVSPKEVTWQQLGHFSKGGAGINFLCDQHGFRLVLVDAGVDYDIPAGHGIIDKKVRKSTRNFRHEAAMTAGEFRLCLERGAEVIDEIHDSTGCNIVSFGEMGSGNTSSSSMWMHLFTGIPLKQCIGAGAGLDSAGIRHKYEVLSDALSRYDGDDSVESKMAWFGGYEMVMAVGAMLRAAELGMVIIVDGFIMTSCILAASRLYPAVLDYAVFGHQGDESGHKLMLENLGVRALLHLDLRLGEGSGAVCAYPIIESAVRMINHMDSFKDVNVTKYF
ncbi:MULTISPECIES: nicotinate-nucleotide--dimethylbenzimidazole phosphoribosyltransferase [Duncaniella]|uniref:Nicotinate-nucleotide--dimethylbenzimidazole phosphoribosyltransferase n=3 Tax=Duncaniella TaxID=2518495 RepID=A0A4P7W023_9BACT|nr:MULTISPECIES: nicotinate-nucleotide--dimethylbenzimidazole phosphoribosyltransferase [Duncaniella]MCX4283467.1 nicotinate-nucleotide--dimethylbenzimidazole phosphoribosyltransferase [Duncaniella dubosii]QCD41191.1 nicotinate-nucleotide--dimethylbenzimidazole phosphoribosyltransferase [Duncaniella dubosii]HBN62911.1 nicotinate-nucleotide--dimethylbenzimidazole phosphoribosyltransferase [Porphyromonadaceae bacterium]